MDHKSPITQENVKSVSLTAILVAYLNRNEISPGDLPPLVARLQHVLNNGHDDPSLGLAENSAMQVGPVETEEGSIHDDYLICLEDGKRFKSLKRHLQTKYDMTPDEYRQKWKLAPDYPMVAPAYARARSEIARSVGLGVLISKRGCKVT